MAGSSGLHDIRDVIEPANGAAARVSSDDRGGVHTMWQSDEYRNIWWCVPLDSLGHDGVKDEESIETARTLLKKIKRHSDPVLRHYGWTVKHLKEHVGGPGGMCYHDNQGTADISLQLRVRPDKQCSAFRPFFSLMGVMIHEMTHISGLGLEDIHPPEFYEKMKEVRGVYSRLLAEGAMDGSDEDTDGVLPRRLPRAGAATSSTSRGSPECCPSAGCASADAALERGSVGDHWYAYP